MLKRFYTYGAVGRVTPAGNILRSAWQSTFPYLFRQIVCMKEYLPSSLPLERYCYGALVTRYLASLLAAGKTQFPPEVTQESLPFLVGDRRDISYVKRDPVRYESRLSKPHWLELNKLHVHKGNAHLSQQRKPVSGGAYRIVDPPIEPSSAASGYDCSA